MAGIGPGLLRMRELFERVAAAAAGGTPIREVIIATNPSPEGDVTLLYLQERLAASVPTITSMARGLPFGADLQYADAVTIMPRAEEFKGHTVQVAFQKPAPVKAVKGKPAPPPKPADHV